MSDFKDLDRANAEIKRLRASLRSFRKSDQLLMREVNERTAQIGKVKEEAKAIADRAGKAFEPPAPECDKMGKVRDKSQEIGEFLDWLRQGGLWVCQAQDSESNPYVPITKTIEQLLADYFGIDLNKVEAEKRALLDYARKMNDVREPLERMS